MAGGPDKAENFKGQLRQAVRRSGTRCVVVAIGNPLRSDDGAGPALAAFLDAAGCRIPVLNAELSPERYLGVIRRLNPELVLLVDAVDLGLEPGEFRLLQAGDLRSVGMSTHDTPLEVLMDEIHDHLGAESLLIGIQPRSLAIGEGLSLEVGKSVDQIGAVIFEVIEESGGKK